MERKQTLYLNKQHKVTLHYIDFSQGPLVYLICFKETNMFYVGYTNNGSDRIQGHFTHKNYTYKEALKNKNIDIRVVGLCNSVSEARCKEQLLIPKFKEKLGNKLLNKLV